MTTSSTFPKIFALTVLVDWALKNKKKIKKKMEKKEEKMKEKKEA